MEMKKVKEYFRFIYSNLEDVLLFLGMFLFFTIPFVLMLKNDLHYIAVAWYVFCSLVISSFGAFYFTRDRNIVN